MDNITRVLLAIVSLGLVATLVVNGANTAKVIQAGGSAFSGSLTAAEKG
jgi:hypothetical protein